MSQSKAYFACASLLGILLASQTNLAWGTVTVCSVDCDKTSIQAGIDQAVAESDNTVLVGPGTYVENITMAENVSVVSEGVDNYIPYTDPFPRPEQFFDEEAADGNLNEKQVLDRATWTIIQGLGSDPVVTFPAGADVVLDGFTIENVDNTALTGTALIDVEDCSPTIQNNIVRDNQGTGQNGGIAIVGGTEVATPLIQNNVIHYVNGHGIGVFSKSAPTIIDNEIFTTPPDILNPDPILGENYRSAPGIGFHDDSAGTILKNHIFFNGAAGIGSRGVDPAEVGGVYDLPGYAFDIRGNHIHNNATSAGILIVGNEDSDPAYPTSGINITIGGPDDENDTNTITDNWVGVRLGCWNNNTNKYLGDVLVENNVISEHTRPGIWVKDITNAVVKDNTIEASHRAGIRTGINKNITIESNTIKNGTYTGIKLQSNDPAYTVLVQNNTLTGNTRSGLLIDGKWLNADIKNNTITSNWFGGINITAATLLNIEDNEIASNHRGGIHTGSYFDGGAGLSVAAGSFDVNIHGNKVHNNGLGPEDGSFAFGAGIDVRHAAGHIENNLVYENETAGIRFGDWIEAINHNTIVDNGAPGITYHDPDGALMGPMSGFPPAPIPIKNNILVGNSVFGINPGTAPPWPEETVCDACQCEQWVNDRDFNLVSANKGLPASDDDPYWEETYGCYVIIGDVCVSIAEPMAIMGFSSQIGICGPYYELDPHVRNGEIYKVPSFVDADTNDYHLQATSAAVGAGEAGVDMGAYGGSDAMDW